MRWIGAAMGAVLAAWAFQAQAQQAEVPAKHTARVPQPNAMVEGAGPILPFAVQNSVEINGSTDIPASPCPYAKTLATDDAQALVLRIAGEEDFDSKFSLSVAQVRSQLVSTAVSGNGTYGLMKLKPETAQRFKVDLCNPSENIQGGVRFLKYLRARYPNPLFALAAYNAGEQALLDHHGIPPFPATVRFVAQVMNDLYGWPSADVSPEAKAMTDIVSPSLPLKPAAAKDPTRPKSRSPQKADAWSLGFVMHVE